MCTGSQAPVSEPQQKVTNLDGDQPKKGFVMLRDGGKTASAFTLAKATLGAGCLSIPASFSQTGLVLSVVLLVVLGGLSVVSINMIVRAQTHSRKDSFEDLVRVYYNNVAGYLFEVVVVIFCFGTAVAYLISVADLLNPVFTKWLGAEAIDTWYGFLLLNRDMFSGLVAAFILLPLSMVNRINDVRWVSFAGVLSVIFLVLSVVYLLVKGGINVDLTTEQLLWPTQGFAPVIGSISGYIFAYVCQVNVPHIYSELQPQSEKDMRRVSWGAVGTCFITYMTIGIAGFLAFGMNTEGSIIVNMTPAFEEGDVFVTIAFVLMAFAVLAAYPLNIYPIRASVKATINGITGRKEQPAWVGPVIVVVAVGCSLVVAIFLPDVQTVLNFVGSVTGSIICYIVPAGFCVQIARHKLGQVRKSEEDEAADAKMNYSNWLSWAMIIFGTAFFFVGTYTSTLDIVDYYS